MKYNFPDQLQPVLGVGYGCESCQARFKLELEVPHNGKKSKTWILATVTWGVKDPCFADVLLVKCPGCGNPCQAIITSQKKRVADLVEAPKVPPTAQAEVPAKPQKPTPPEKAEPPLTGKPRFTPNRTEGAKQNGKT